MSAVLIVELADVHL